MDAWTGVRGRWPIVEDIQGPAFPLLHASLEYLILEPETEYALLKLREIHPARHRLKHQTLLVNKESRPIGTGLDFPRYHPTSPISQGTLKGTQPYPVSDNG
jgi:hypothetical protein